MVLFKIGRVFPSHAKQGIKNLTRLQGYAGWNESLLFTFVMNAGHLRIHAIHGATVVFIEYFIRNETAVLYIRRGNRENLEIIGHISL